MHTNHRLSSCALLSLSLLALGCNEPEQAPSEEKAAAENSAPAADEIVVYSGRAEPLVAPVLQRFEKETGVRVKVRYGDTAALTALLLEEKDRSPAAVFFAQDAGALGALEASALSAPLPDDVLARVPPSYRSSKGQWVGVSGRVRTVVYNTAKLKADELPGSVLELTDPKWKGRVGWAPTNGSFQAFVTGLRLLHGDEKAEQWLVAMKANEPKEYPKNGAIVQAVGAGEIDVGLVNHYYLHRALAEDASFPAQNHYAAAGDAGALVNVAGLALLSRAQGAERDAALKLVRYLLAADAQSYFAKETFEYPLVDGATAPAGVPSLSTLKPPAIDLGGLSDLEGTLALLRKAKALP